MEIESEKLKARSIDEMAEEAQKYRDYFNGTNWLDPLQWTIQYYFLYLWDK